jgi:hypothetical protein
MGNVVSISGGAKGFDFDGVISGAYAACISSLPAPNNKNFVGRYISHTSTEASPDLTSGEAIGLTENGLAILVVQHCYKPVSFTDYATQGTTDANTAISHLNAMGAPAGMFVYCDIENFPSATAGAEYAQAWANTINAASVDVLGWVLRTTKYPQSNHGRHFSRPLGEYR